VVVVVASVALIARLKIRITIIIDPFNRKSIEKMIAIIDVGNTIMNHLITGILRMHLKNDVSSYDMVVFMVT